MIVDVKNVAKNYNLVNFKLNGFGYFDNPGGKVIYADIEPSKELEELRWGLAKELMKYVRLKEWDRRERFSFHATIAFKDIDRKFSKIWSYLKHKEKPNIDQHLLRITIIGNRGRIVSEYDLMRILRGIHRLCDERRRSESSIRRWAAAASSCRLRRTSSHRDRGWSLLVAGSLLSRYQRLKMRLSLLMDITPVRCGLAISLLS